MCSLSQFISIGLFTSDQTHLRDHSISMQMIGQQSLGYVGRVGLEKE